MSLDLSKSESLFERLQDGNHDVLVEIIEAERPRIFDFLLRMTGQRDSAIDVLDEVAKALSSHPEQFKDLQALRVSLYATVRSFSADHWNAETSQLINDGYAALEKSPVTANLDFDNLKNIERQLANLPGWEREPILLQLRCGFVGGDVADVMGIDEMSSSFSFRSGIAKIGRATNQDFDSVENGVSRIPAHPLSLQSQESTVALSQIMDDIGRVRRSGNRWLTPLIVTILVAVAAYFLFWHK